MDKNNCKLKILFKCIKANTSAKWQHRLHMLLDTTCGLCMYKKKKEKIKNKNKNKEKQLWQEEQEQLRQFDFKQKIEHSTRKRIRTYTSRGCNSIFPGWPRDRLPIMPLPASGVHAHAQPHMISGLRLIQSAAGTNGKLWYKKFEIEEHFFNVTSLFSARKIVIDRINNYWLWQLAKKSTW